MLKLIEVKSGWQTNWHSILEQTYGLMNGIGRLFKPGQSRREPKRAS